MTYRELREAEEKDGEGTRRDCYTIIYHRGTGIGMYMHITLPRICRQRQRRLLLGCEGCEHIILEKHAYLPEGRQRHLSLEMVYTGENNSSKFKMRWDKFVDNLTFMSESHGICKMVKEMKHENEVMNFLMNNRDIK